jgi:phytanoyl-CoA hydroxylase
LPEHRMKPSKILDLYWFNESVRNALLSPSIVSFVHKIFEDAPSLFQSLNFERGTQQSIHQDTAYVVTDQPMRLLASWIALEDIKIGSGELQYYVGSHRLPDFDFGGKKHWDPAIDGQTIHDQFLEWIHTEAKKANMAIQSFLPKQGDALIWHAALAHGGSTIADPTATRKSLVGHYCPVKCTPNYFKFMDYRPERKRVKSGKISAAYCSNYYK